MGVSIREAPLEEVPQPWIQFAVSDNPEPPKDVTGPIDWFRYVDPRIEKTFAGIADRICAPETCGTAAPPDYILLPCFSPLFDVYTEFGTLPL